MLKDKIRDFKNAKENVRLARPEFKELEKHFGCYDTVGAVCAGDPCDDNGGEIPCCRQYDLSVHCPYKECKNYDWNTKHYYAHIKLCNVKMDKFLAFINLFKRIK